MNSAWSTIAKRTVQKRKSVLLTGLIAEAKAEKRQKKLFGVRDQKRTEGFMMALLTFICQLILCILIFFQLFYGKCN